MSKDKIVADLKRIAGEIDYYAENMVVNPENLKSFSIWIRINTDGSEISSYEVDCEYA